jgi:ABC-type lipoprotein release transport system permease subunit
MILLLLAFKSLRSRAVTTSLTIFSIALSVMLLVGVDRVREGTQKGFEGTLSHVDLVVGARGGSLPLLLYSVFHIGTANNDISYASYEHFRDHAAVKWTIPFSLGDSFHDYRVVATDDNFYDHYQYRGGQSLRLSQGVRAEDIFDVVLGSEVAQHLGYKLGQQIVLTHGIEGSFINHKDKPFTVVGILAPTATRSTSRSMAMRRCTSASSMAHRRLSLPLPRRSTRKTCTSTRSAPSLSRTSHASARCSSSARSIPISPSRSPPSSRRSRSKTFGAS